MLKRIALVATFSMLSAFFFVPSARADSHWSVHIGVGAPVVAPPPPGYVWQPGYYVAGAYGYRWVPGTWVPGGYYNHHPYYNPGYGVGGSWGVDRWAPNRWRDEYRGRDRDWDDDRERGEHRDREWQERGRR